jgi:dCTP diphosphatase
MSDGDSTVLSLRHQVEAFVSERDWQQYHNAKDLAGAIAIEAAELMELFLWKSPEEVEGVILNSALGHRIEEELADVLILSLSLANRLNIDVAAVIEAKLVINATKYPADLARGRAEKYTHYVSIEEAQSEQ